MKDEKEEFAVLIDFANLDLKNTPPTSKEKQRFIDFFEKYAPKSLQYQTAEEIPEHFDLEPNGMLFRTLGWFERDYQKNWFESDHFNNFFYEFRFIRLLLEQYMEGKIKPALLLKLQKRIEEYKPSFAVFKGNDFVPLVDSTEPLVVREIRIEFTLVPTPLQKANFVFHIIPRPLITKIHHALRSVLAKKPAIKRCAYADCNNMFIKGAGRKYCSAECRRKLDADAKREEAKQVHEALCYLIEKWIEQNNDKVGKWKTASELKSELKRVAKKDGKYNRESVKTPFLYKDARSIGSLLKESDVDKRLKDKGILLKKSRRKNPRRKYLFTKVRSNS